MRKQGAYPRVVLLLWLGTTLCAAAIWSAEPGADSPTSLPDDVSRQEQIRFEQQKALAHMRELEDRMYRLAELIRETQPNDSARLLMGVRKAREGLITEQMLEVVDLLSTLKLNQATGEQKKIIAKLEELKNLLLTSDLGLELQIERLRKIGQARESLERLIKKEQQQHDETSDIAERSESDQQRLQTLQRDEQRNREAGDDLQQLVKRIGAAGQAASAIGEASASMGQAAGSLGQGKPGQAAQSQGEALEQLRQADRELAEQEARLRDELKESVRQRVMDDIAQMITKQRQIREATMKLAPRAADGQRQAVLAVRRLAGAEDRIVAQADEAIELVELTEFSFVLPAALRTVKARMIAVSVALTDGRADEPVVADQRQIEEQLQALLAAMKDAAQSPGQNAPPGGQCPGCGGNRNQLMAEVKILLWLQKSLNQDTASLLERQAENTTPGEELQRRADDLMQRQDEIRAITQRLHESTCEQCTQGDH